MANVLREPEVRPLLVEEGCLREVGVLRAVGKRLEPEPPVGDSRHAAQRGHGHKARAVPQRRNKRLVTRMRFAALRYEVIVEDVDLRAPRGFDRPLYQKLAAGDWISRKQNLLIIGPSGVGKSWLACARPQGLP